MRRSGFTLIEVLVALVIVSLMAAGFSVYVQQQAVRSAALEDRTFAAVIASNALAALQASGAWPEPGRARERVRMAGRDWEVKTVITDTGSETLRRVEVSVADAADGEPTFGLTGFLGRH